MVPAQSFNLLFDLVLTPFTCGIGRTRKSPDQGRNPVNQIRDSESAWFQLNLGTTTVHEKFDSVDEATVIASQKDHRFGDFVGFPYAS